MFTQEQIYRYLAQSIDEAQAAFDAGNYPIGSVIVDSIGIVCSVDRNESNSSGDITAHAEMLALRNLGAKINKDTPGEFYLFTSLEPCFGCSFFLARTNIRHIYSALVDPHKGGISKLAEQEQFANFFRGFERVNEPYPDLKEASRQLMIRYFVDHGRPDAAKFYGYTE